MERPLASKYIINPMNRIIAIMILHCSLYASCGGCGRGESILSRVSPGVVTIDNVASLDNLFAYNTVTDFELLIPPGTPISFNSPVLVHGNGITELNPSTFLITKTGHYLATFVGETFGIDLDGAEYQLNGVSQGVSIDFGTPLVLNQILNVTSVPSTLQVMSIGTGVRLTQGTSATISIVQLNSP